MSNSHHPPSHPDDVAAYVAAADDYTPVDVLETDEDDEDGDSSSGEGGSKDRRSKKYEVILDPLLEFKDDLSLDEDENALSKLRKLGLAPMSLLVSGQTAYASENDLSRKVFMAEVGLINLEIKPYDIADPKLFQKLDGKQAERRALFGIKTLDDIVAGAVGAAAAVVGIVSASVADYVKDKREERKVSRQIRDFESGKEIYALDSDDALEARSSMEAAEFPVQDNQGDDMDDRARERLMDLLDSQSGIQNFDSYADSIEAAEARRLGLQAAGHTDPMKDLSGLFNVISSITLADMVQKVELADGVRVARDGPSSARGVDNPMMK